MRASAVLGSATCPFAHAQVRVECVRSKVRGVEGIVAYWPSVGILDFDFPLSFDFPKEMFM
jgi:hypothetical protein